MRNLISALKMNLLLLLALSLIAGCGTGGLSDAPATSTGGGTTGGTTGTPVVTPAKLDLLVSSTQLKSDMVGAPTVTLTAIVKDSGNRALTGQTVAFSADSGVLGFVSGTTDDNGMATAKLGASGDPTYRTINVWATSGGVTGANAVAVTGTQISIDPADFSLPFNDSTGKQLVISLKDSEGKAILGKTVSLTAASQSTFSAASYLTNNSGQITVTVKNAADTVGDTITASAIGVSSQSALTINTAKLVISAPAAAAKVPINTLQPFNVTYTKNGNPPVPEQTIYFTTTRGTLTASSRTTVGGSASVNISSANSGPAILTAYTTDGTVQVSTQASIVFVANTAAKMTLSASPAVINTNAPGLASEQSLIKAIVRDASDNLVMGKTVVFSIFQDASGGTLAKPSATTDMYGMATTNYIAGSASGGLNNVLIKATVSDPPAPDVTATTTLTVGGQALFVTLATGPTIQKVDPNKYQKDYVALVTDAGGRAVANAVVTATVTPQYYLKGYYSYCGTTPERWCQRRTLVSSKSTAPTVPACANEDGILQNSLYDFNGILDPGEDQNANSRLDPGNVASVTATTTDSKGHSTVSLVYAADYAFWVNVRLEVRASLAGSTTGAFQTFELPGLAKDYSDITIDPPGNPSPFGSNTTCYAALSVIALDPTKISLNWDPSAYASSYNIYRDKNESPRVVVLISNVTKTTYQDPVAAGPTYCYEIKQVDATGVESPLSPTGNRVCVGSQSVAPTGVGAVAISPTQIQVDWADAGAATYRIYQNDIPLQYSITRSIVSGNLTANTMYCYAVSSLNKEGVESSKSSTACATTQLSPPAIPTGLLVNATSDSQITVLWTAGVAGTAYRVYRDGVKLSDAAAAALTDTGLTAGTRYCYAVSAYDAAGSESAQTAQRCATTQPAPPPVPPPVPTGLTATAVSQSQINLSWTAVTGADGYALYRGGTYWTTVGGTTASDTGLTNSTQYCYTVASVSSSGGASAQSSGVCVTTPTPPPLAPTGLTPTAASASQMDITWAISAGAAGYKVYRGGVLLASTIATTLADTGLASGTTYCYMVSAYNATGSESAMSTQACAATNTIPVPTWGVLGGVTAATSSQINLTWTVSAGAAGYRIYKDGAYLKSVTTTSASDTGLTAETTYCYSITAFDLANNESAKTSQLCATTPAPAPTYIDLLVSNPQLNSDGASTVTLTALVKDSSNRALANQAVAFSATSGLVTVTSATTNASGAATATLGTGADKGNRTITMTAATGTINATNTVNVVGTTITISGQNSLVLNDSTTLTISLKDSAGNGIANKQIDVSSLYNTVNNQAPTVVTTITTDTNGQGTVTLKATDAFARTDTITAASVAMGTTGTFSVSVTANVNFTFTLPTPAGKNIAINTNEPVEILYTTALGVPVDGVTVYFATSRGSLSAPSAVTGAVTTGKAKGVTVSSNNPGTAILTAYVTGGPSAQLSVEFIATSPTKMTLQADPPVIGTNISGSITQKSAIIAVVRDAEDNLVKNKTVNFTLATDPSVGYISPVSATTDSFGTVTTTYFAGVTPSGASGVVINAAVAGTAVTASTTLTVAQKPLFITLGAQNALTGVSPVFYQQDFGILVTDAAGNPVSGATVTATITPVVYMKGNYNIVGASWTQSLTLNGAGSRHLPAGYPWPTTPANSCSNEDLYYYGDAAHPSYLLNGYLDPLEDGNANGKLDPGGVAAVTSSVTTGANGTGALSVIYDKKYASWVIVRLDVRVIVAGTEGSAYEVFTLGALADDVKSTAPYPPFGTSPFGTSTTCSDDN